MTIKTGFGKCPEA